MGQSLTTPNVQLIFRPRTAVDGAGSYFRLGATPALDTSARAFHAMVEENQAGGIEHQAQRRRRSRGTREEPPRGDYREEVSWRFYILTVIFASVALCCLLESSALCAATGEDAKKAQPTHPLLAKEAGAWVIELQSSGGYTGHGGRSGVISSAGQVQAARTPMPRFLCRSKLSAQELSPLRTAVLAARPEQWGENYVPSGDNGCCDRFRYNITLHQRISDGTARTRWTTWYQGSDGLLPGDLAALMRAMDSILDKALAHCRQ
jgi:hypothetical protein